MSLAHRGFGITGNENTGMPSFKRGGKKRGKGAAKLHKDERIAAPKKSKRSRKGGRS